MPPLHKTAPQLHPPTVEGKTCLQRAFGGNWQTASNIAVVLGYEITYPGIGGHHWQYVPHEAIGEINATLARWGAEYHAAHSVTRDHVSCRIADLWLRFSTATFATQIGAPMKRAGTTEPFIAMSDIGLIVTAARASTPPGPGWRTDPDAVDQFVQWIEAHGLAGLTIIEARRERRLPGGF